MSGETSGAAAESETGQECGALSCTLYTQVFVLNIIGTLHVHKTVHLCDVHIRTLTAHTYLRMYVCTVLTYYYIL